MTNYYFIGIKGTGMASLARILHDQGNAVSGSDIEKETFTQFPLIKEGIQITDFNIDHIKKNQVVIRGNAFSVDHPQVIQAKRLGDRVLSYPQAVEEVIRSHTSIAIAGTHGKTSTTGLISHILSDRLTTSYLIGDGVGKGAADSKYFVVEADEYRRHFSTYTPDIAVITNIDWDHPDYYRDKDDVFKAFSEFADKVNKIIFAYGEDSEIKRLKPKKALIKTFGFKPSDDFYITDIEKKTSGTAFKIVHDGKRSEEFFAKIEGEHGLIDTTAAIVVAEYLKISEQDIAGSLLSYTGVKRRFNIHHFAGFTLIDDYAHHPNEIKATIDAARQKFPDKRIVAVFQPHTYSRVRAFKDEYVDVLKAADKVFITPIFGSLREKNGDVKSEDILNKLPNAGSIITENNVKEELSPEKDSVLVFMGAGDIEKYEDKLKD